MAAAVPALQRLFVGAYPPLDTARALLRIAESRALPPRRATPPEQVHVTLHFLGDTAARELDAIGESIERSVAGIAPMRLRPRSLVVLPERGPARLVAATTDAPPSLLEIVRRLALRLARQPRPNAANRFLPHLTLCRFQQPTPTLSRTPIPLNVDAFDLHEIVLMRSLLSPGGAKHVPVRRFPLGQ